MQLLVFVGVCRGSVQAALEGAFSGRAKFVRNRW